MLVVVSVSGSGTNESVSGINWDNLGTPVPLLRLGRVNDAAAQVWAEIWYLQAPAVTGTKQIAVTYTGTAAVGAGSGSWFGVGGWNAASPQSTTGSGATATLNLTSGAGEWTVDCIGLNVGSGTDPITVGGSQNTIINATVGSAAITVGGSDLSASGSPNTMSWSAIANPWAYIGASMTAAAPIITMQPSNQAVFEGQQASFSVSATSSGGSLTYQWQRDDGSGFNDIGGATNSSYTTPATVYADDNGDLYRVNVTDDNGTVTSSNALLTVIIAGRIGWLRG
jgi:hypothetical protein